MLVLAAILAAAAHASVLRRTEALATTGGAVYDTHYHEKVGVALSPRHKEGTGANVLAQHPYLCEQISAVINQVRVITVQGRGP